MIDSVIKGTGNSRKLKSISNFAAQYPTYEAFASAMASGTLPIDLGINEAGWAQLGTALNKGNLFSDTTAAKYPAGTDTPDQALGVLGDAAVADSVIVHSKVAGEWWETVGDANLGNVYYISYIKELGILFVSSNSGIYYSKNMGISYTKINTSYDETSEVHFAYGNGMIVTAAFSTGRYYTSTDGKTYTPRSGAGIGQITFDGKRFVTASDASDGAKIKYSTDGINWSTKHMGAPSSNYRALKVQYLDGYCIFYLAYINGSTIYYTDVVNGTGKTGSWKFNLRSSDIYKYKGKYFATEEHQDTSSSPTVYTYALMRSDSPVDSVNPAKLVLPGISKFLLTTDDNLYILLTDGRMYKVVDPLSDSMGLQLISNPVNRGFAAASIPSEKYQSLSVIVSPTKTIQTYDEYITENELQTVLGKTLQIPSRQVTGLDFAKVAIGTYTGTGTYGSNNPNTLMFLFAPKYIFITRPDLGATAAGTNLNMVYDSPKANAPSATVDVIWNKNSVSWYSTSADNYQLNLSGQTYYYFAIG